MAFIRRRATPRRSSLNAELMYLLFVVAAGTATAYWAEYKLGMDLSAINTVASVLGLTETIGVTRPVGYSEATAAPEPEAAPYCKPGQEPAFSTGMSALHQRMGAAMGTPLECEHTGAAIGDMVQQTTGGLAAYYKLFDTSTFTDGWHHWALTPTGYVTWDGADSQPPAASGPGAG